MTLYCKAIAVCLLVATASLAATWNVGTLNVGTLSIGEPPQEDQEEAVSLAMPAVGDYALTVVASNTLELFRVTRKDPYPAAYTQWSFIDTNGAGSLPATSDFVVTTNGVVIPVSAVAFKRRPLFGPLTPRDFRVGNEIYLTLASGIPTNASVVVSNVSGALWSGYNYSTNALWTRVSPAVHVNQTGYIPGQPKKAMVGFYLGSGGELASVPTNTFHLLNNSGASVFSGGLALRPDVGYTYTATPYQKVWEADFSAFDTPGKYRLFVPTLGCSYPFWIDSGVAANYARTYALGIYHQRCGTNLALPYTRHEHGTCHTNFAYIPTAPGNTAMSNWVNGIMQQEGQLDYISDVHYPYLNTNRFDSAGGHHDAGDYSKYTTSVAKLVHFLTFAVDALPGVRHLDNLGIPESGNGVPDLLDEAKWEADYLAKIQDSDGGFYMLCYPTNSQYENVLPENGSGQLMMPKSTVATAAAVGALAEIASSPAFKAAYPTEAASYLTKAWNGWGFITNAINAHGFDGSFQEIMFQGAVFGHTDEVFYAACSLYTATTNTYFSNYLRSVCPTPYSTDNRRWSWWSCFEGYGFGFQQLAFAVSSGKLDNSHLDSTYLDSVKAELRFAGTNNKTWSDHNAYGTSFSDENKPSRLGGWYFSSEWALDSAVQYALDGRAQDMDVVLKNFNYEMGCNPVNVAFLTGTGYRRQRASVNQYAENDDREFPPTGIPLGNIKAGYDSLSLYPSPEREQMSYPSDSASNDPFPYYDRWEDTFNTTTEWVVSQAARSLATAAYVAALNGQTNQTWNSAVAHALISTNRVVLGLTGTVGVTASGVSLTDALVAWEVEGEPPNIVGTRTLAPTAAAYRRVEAEAVLPDGRRVFARTNFYATATVTNNIEDYQITPLADNANAVGWYKLDGTLTDTKGNGSTLTFTGTAAYDAGSWLWTNRPAGQAVRLQGFGDRLEGTFPNASLSSSDVVSIEYMMLLNEFDNYGVGTANFTQLEKNSNARLHFFWSTFEAEGPYIEGSARWAQPGQITNALPAGVWHHVKIAITSSNYQFAVNGITKTNSASGELANWGGAGSATLVVGDYDGWVDEVVIKKGY